ncbi:integral membrane sensor domain MASE1 [Kitasatospora kifunensis]|uniref:Integral membrane sensor domain MASE1 n=1 Tax=Kitasatospora kifunensis TaxID=58351 RepID=A0A7W7R472_KITKI|nr:MASE1 domain-containing protein [Kitasatospora kifunensis]MBB4925135.1 integral membrane sensor domain MASE1 [Kitasatospora kifunensis]
MTRNQDLRRPLAAVLRVLAVAAAYFVAGQLGLIQQIVVAGAKVTPLWPPTGIALTCLLLLGLRIWPGIALGAVAVVTAIGPLHPASFGIMAGNTAAPIVAYLLLRATGFRSELDRLRDGLALVFLGAGGMLVSATVGVGLLRLADSVPADDFWSAWSAWWTGDAMGVLVCAPLLLALYRFRLPEDAGPFDLIEPVVLLAGTVLVTLAVTNTHLSLLFLVFPLLIWAALRFQLIGAAPCVLLVSVLAITAATAHRGPFAQRDVLQTMVILQALNGASALTGLLLSAIIAEQQSMYRRIELACLGLTEVVARLAPGEGGPGWPHPEDDGRPRL